jgi:hypothetical protein
MAKPFLVTVLRTPFNCPVCGHIDEFVGNAVELWKVEGGYPAPAS